MYVEIYVFGERHKSWYHRVSFWGQRTISDCLLRSTVHSEYFIYLCVASRLLCERVYKRRHRDMVYQYAQFAECNDCHNFIMSFNINNLEWSQICTKPNRSHELCYTKFMDPKTAAPPNFETLDDMVGGWKAGGMLSKLITEHLTRTATRLHHVVCREC